MDPVAVPSARASGIPLWAKLGLFALFGGIVGLALFTVSYAEATSYLSDDPAACRNCHVMNDVYDAWVRGPHHAVATCNDCHTPHEFPGLPQPAGGIARPGRRGELRPDGAALR